MRIKVAIFFGVILLMEKHWKTVVFENAQRCDYDIKTIFFIDVVDMLSITIDTYKNYRYDNQLARIYRL